MTEDKHEVRPKRRVELDAWLERSGRLLREYDIRGNRLVEVDHRVVETRG